jgi:hypothetical protein
MQTLEEVKDENELTKKKAQKRRVIGLLIVLNALLVSYAGYLSVASIVDAVSKNNGGQVGETISILSKNEADSLRIYNKYITEKDDILDVATYGRYLLTSNARVSYNLENDTSSVRLLNLTEIENDDASSTKITTLGTKLNEQIDLFSLTPGDYIFASEMTSEGYKALHYTGDEYYEDVLYSFPKEDGTRTKITIKGKASSPALVVNVNKQEASLPADYYDLVILKDDTINIDWFSQTSLKIKEVNSLTDAYKAKASYALNIVSGNDIVSSNYLNDAYTKPNKILVGSLSGLDEDDAIRELGGHVFNAGYGESTSQASKDVYKVKSSSHIGKYTLSVGVSIENPEQTIKSIFNY